MIYGFKCKKCDKTHDLNLPVGQTKDVKCPDCSEIMSRVWGCNFILKGWFPGKSISFNSEMTRRNEEAGERMRRTAPEKPGMKLAALDYGNGDIRELPKK